jgi:amidase
VSLTGALDMAPSLDTCGWFTRDINTYLRVAEVLLGNDPHPLPERVRVLRSPQLDALAQPEALQALSSAVQRVEAVAGAATPLASDLLDIESMFWSVRHIQGHETWGINRALIKQFAPPLGPGVSQRFEWSSHVTDAQMEQARAQRAQLQAKWSQVMGQDGVLVLPTMPDIAPLSNLSESEMDDYRNRSVLLLCLSGLTGCPQISLPLASRQGAPLGLSLMGPPGSDLSLVRLAQRVMAA